MNIWVDGLFIRSLLCSFFFKVFPEIIDDNRLFIAEPPLYRVDDKKNPFVINKDEYVQRYIQSVIKEYNIGWYNEDRIEFFNLRNKNDLEQLKTLLSDTSSYVDDILMLSQHYKVNDRLIEMIIEEFGFRMFPSDMSLEDKIKNINIQEMMNRIGEEFTELYFDDKDNIIKGVIDGRYQSIEISERLVRKASPLFRLIELYGPRPNKPVVLKNIKTGSEEELSLLGVLKVLKKYQPSIIHRFKGLGENDDEDIKTTIMDPNTRSLIRVQISDIVNDMKIFQVLRGNSPLDAQNRKIMMKEFKIDRNDIDT